MISRVNGLNGENYVNGSIPTLSAIEKEAKNPWIIIDSSPLRGHSKWLAPEIFDGEILKRTPQHNSQSSKIRNKKREQQFGLSFASLIDFCSKSEEHIFKKKTPKLCYDCIIFPFLVQCATPLMVANGSTFGKPVNLSLCLWQIPLHWSVKILSSISKVKK